MFERFTRSARDVVVRASTEARELGHPWVGTEHLLLALLRDPAWPVAAVLRTHGVDEAHVRAEIRRRVGPADPDEPAPDTDAEDAAALKAIGIDLDAVRRAIEETFGPGALRLPPAAPRRRRGLFGRGHTPFTGRAKKVLELALREALRLDHHFIAREHILLGLLRDGKGLAARILADGGVDFADLRAAATRSLDDRAA
jgi:ATP-dependent Clp protease ATP-binding subunit ClpA